MFLFWSSIHLYTSITSSSEHDAKAKVSALSYGGTLDSKLIEDRMRKLFLCVKLVLDFEVDA